MTKEKAAPTASPAAIPKASIDPAVAAKRRSTRL